jgi:DNA-binding response OmpR family regulator
MASGSPNGTARSHVFCVNRSPAFLELLADLLEEERYAVSTTTHHETAFAQILAARPDAVIVDVVAWDDDAWQLLQRLSTDAATAAIPLVATSTDPAVVERAQAQPARYRPDRCLVKPFDLWALVDALDSLLRSA